MNTLMLSGLVDDDKDKTCFFEMSQYDDGERGNRLALWEDFELRGFSPLAPAQLILDFSRNCSLENDVSNKEKSAPVKRILAAGRALMNVVRICQQEIYYDSKQKKFIIGTKAAACEDLNVYRSDDFDIIGPVGNTGMMQSDTTNLQAKQSWGQLFVDGEEEDEVIVFKPMAAEKDTNMSASDCTKFFQSVSQPPAQHITRGISKWSMDQESFVGRLKSLSIAKNELYANPDLLNGLSSLQPTTFSPSLSATTNLNTSSSSMLSGHIRAGEAVIAAEVDSIVPLGANSNGLNMKVSAALPAPRKNPISQRARHFGPPPGFSKNPAKQLEDSNSKFVIKEQQPLMEDYSWHDGYKTLTTTGMGMGNSINRDTHMYPQVTASTSNGITGAISFPFPGKQIPAAQTEMTYAKKWQDLQFFEHLKLHAEQQLPQGSQQSALLPEQYQAQSLWSSYFFV